MAKDRNDRNPRRRRRSGLVDIVNAFLTLIVLGLLAAVGLFMYGAKIFYEPGSVKADTHFQVESGSRLATIADRLEEQGLIANKWVFQLGTWALKKQAGLKAGEYLLKADSSMEQVLRELTEGRPITYAVVIPEGFTSWQVVDRLNGRDDLSGDPAEPPPEGSVLPMSYDYERGADRAGVLARMQAQMTAKLAEIYASCRPDVCGVNGVIHSPEEMVTLASVVEKETGVATERPHVAAVFVNRLKKKMRLQSDPTIIYGITKGVGKLDRPIRRSEIEAKNDYNTYQRDGLPAGPIANPGIEALRAVANPADTRDLYFVAKSASPSDGHLFATTYAQHQKNVQAYRKAASEAEAENAKEALEAEQAKASGDAPATP